VDSAESLSLREEHARLEADLRRQLGETAHAKDRAEQAAQALTGQLNKVWDLVG